MKAIVLREAGGPEVLRLEEAPDPQPGTGRSCASARRRRLNRRDVWIPPGDVCGFLKYPVIPGSDGAGEVEALGAGVTGLTAGQAVVIYPSLDWGEAESHQGPAFRILGIPDDGTYAERVCVRRRTSFPSRRHLSWEEAAALPLAGSLPTARSSPAGGCAPARRC